MTKKAEMIDKIYEVIADKTLSFGCIINDENHGKCIYLQTSGDWNIGYDCFIVGLKINQGYCEWIADIYIGEIIGHPVMIGDVLDYIKTIEIHYDEIISLVMSWEQKRKPIEEQSEECIEFVYNLLS